LRGRAAAGLVFVLAVALALRLLFALTHPLDYNAYWHVFIARNLSREHAQLAHPPLYLLLLKAADAASHSPLAYQMVALLSGLGVVVLARSILLRLRASRTSAELAALTMAVALPAVILSTGAQSYMLAAFFIFGSFLAYLDLVQPDATARWRSRAAFAALACLGLLTEYYTAFYVAACVGAPWLVAAFRPAYRSALLRALPRRLAPDVATLLPPLLVGAALYFRAKMWLLRFPVLPEFYFRPGQETAAGFLTRNLGNLFNLFAPVRLEGPLLAAALVLGFAVLVFLVPVRHRREEASETDRAMPGALLALLLLIGMAMGLGGPYPFGGQMRQQFLYFLFAVPAGSLAFDEALRRVTGGRTRAALAALVVAVLAANAWRHAGELRGAQDRDFEQQASVFHDAFPDADTIQVDQLNLIGFFIPHDAWEWRFDGYVRYDPVIERYVLERGGRTLTLLAHRHRWNFDFHDATLYRDLASALGPGDADCFNVFCVHTNFYKPPERRLPDLVAREVTARMAVLAAQAGLAPGKTVLRGNDVYAGFCRTRE
jgi:hypothetical protein